MSPTCLTSIFKSTSNDVSQVVTDHRALLYVVLTTGGVYQRITSRLNDHLMLRGWLKQVFITYLVVHRLILYPYLLSPLRSIPGPSLGNPILGQFRNIIKGEAGIPQRQWVKQYGSVVRVVGPIGIERLIFTKADVLHKILVSDWVEYPRVHAFLFIEYDLIKIREQPGFMRDILGLTVGYGLLTVTGNEHRQMRKTMNPAFAIPNLMARAFILASLSRDIANNLLQRLTCIMRLLIGLLVNCLDYWLSNWN